MNLILNPNGKRPTTTQTNHHHPHYYQQQQQQQQQQLQQQLQQQQQQQQLHIEQRNPLDPLINQSSKRPRTSLNYKHHHHQQPPSPSPPPSPPLLPLPLPDTNQKQRPTIKKSLSGLIPNQTNHTPLDLLNPSNQSPTLRTTKQQQQQQPIKQQQSIQQQQHQQHQHQHQPTNNVSRPKDKDELKREMAQWQEKYRVAIKSFVFYLDRLDPSTTADLKSKIRAWGARVDQFFSKEVTHIITNIPVPTNIPALSPSPCKRNSAYCLPSPTRNNKENGQMTLGPRRNLKRLSLLCSPEKDRLTESNIPPLIRKALELKIKIWKTEKLLNVLYRLGDQRSPLKHQQQQLQHHHHHHQQHHQQQQQQLLKPSLPSLLLKEAQQGHTNEFDPVSLRPDYYYFGPKAMFIMVEDTTQEHKPIIVKEYSRPKTREAASWPIMWGGTEGKSVFSRHTAKQSYLHVRNRIRQMFEMLARDSIRQKKLDSARERSQSLDYQTPSRRPVLDRTPPAKQQNLRRAVSMNMLQRRQSGRLSRTITIANDQPDEEETTEHDPDDEECREIDHVNQAAPDHYRGNNRVFLAASGNSVTVTSNVASATSTRSSAVRLTQVGGQLIDKRLAALGKRPTFQINQFNSTGIGSSSLKREIGAESSKDRLQNLRRELDSTNKLKRSQSLDSSMISKKKAANNPKANSNRRGLGVRAKLGNGFDLIDLRRLVRNEEPKTGYCENCRLKYSDFRKHILTRKHRKFALDENNWIHLDDTLKKTTRQLKPGVAVPPSVREMILSMHDSDDGQEEDEDEDEDEENDHEQEEDDEDEDDENENDDNVEEEENDDDDDGQEEEEEEEEGVEEESEGEEEVDVQDHERQAEIKRGSPVEEEGLAEQDDDRVEADELEEGEYDETEDHEEEIEKEEGEEEEEEEEEEGQITQSNCLDYLHPSQSSHLQPDHHLPYELEEGEWELEDDNQSAGNVFF